MPVDSCLVCSGVKSIDGLLRLTEDPSADVRLNAAIGLASLR